MDQRDRAFLVDMTDFMCMNRIATVFALLQSATEPESIAKFTVQQLYFTASESVLHELTEKNAGNIQGIMVARIYAELFAGYEDIGTFGSAIKHRARGGIFGRYVASTTREAVTFLQDILNSNIPEHPEITLDSLLRLPPIPEVQEILPHEVVAQLTSYYRQVPQYLYAVAKHYRMRRSEVQSFTTGELSADALQSNLAIILGFVPSEGIAREGRVSTDTFNRIKHQFLVTGNLASYSDPHDTRSLEYSLLSRDQSFLEGVIESVISVSRVMSELASILLLFEHQHLRL